MTERAEDIAQCAAAQAAGETFAASHTQARERILGRVSGSGEDLADSLLSTDDIAVPGLGTPSEPPGVSPQPSRVPNVTNPLDNSQSQP